MAELTTTEADVESQGDGVNADPDESGDGPAPRETPPEENPFQVVGRLAKDPRYQQAIRTIAGRDPDYRAAIRERDELKARLSNVEAERTAAQYQTMDQEELAQRLRDDPEFRAQFAKDTAPREKTQQIPPEIARFRDMVLDTIDDLVMDGMPPQWKDQILGYVREGQFGRVESDGTAGVTRRITEYANGLKARRPWEAAQPAAAAKADEADDDDEQDGEREPAPSNQRRPNPRLAENADMRPTSSAEGRRNSRPRYSTWTEASILYNEGRISSEEYRKAKATLPFE